MKFIQAVCSSKIYHTLYSNYIDSIQTNNKKNLNYTQSLTKSHVLKMYNMLRLLSNVGDSSYIVLQAKCMDYTCLFGHAPQNLNNE